MRVTRAGGKRPWLFGWSLADEREFLASPYGQSISVARGEVFWFVEGDNEPCRMYRRENFTEGQAKRLFWKMTTPNRPTGRE